MSPRSSGRGSRGFLLLSVIAVACFVLPRLSSSSVQRTFEAAVPSSIRLRQSVHAPLAPKTSPGFEEALPSCRVLDLPNDPLIAKYGHNNIRLSRTYEGSGARIRRLLRKALAGHAIKIAVIGGSVSLGHGVASPRDHTNWYPKVILKWFQDTFPGADHLLNEDSMLAAITAHYFSFCIGETLPDDTDLIIVELDINSNFPTPHFLTATESLARTLLELPSNPAILYLSVFGLVFEDMTLGWRQSSLVTQWLDIPMINIRNFALRGLLDDASRVPALFTNHVGELDMRHINANCHVALADMATGYLREQLCLLQRSGPFDNEPLSDNWPRNDITTTVPRLGMLHKYNESTVWPLMHPKCKTVASQRFPLEPLESDGWVLVNINDKKTWEATRLGATITFEVDPQEGLLGFIHWKTGDESFGNVRCHVDRYHEHVREIWGFIPGEPVPKFDYTGDVWDRIPRGTHNLTCTIVPGLHNGTTFRINAVAMR